VIPVILARHPRLTGGEGLCYGRRDLPLAEGWERDVDRWSALAAGHGCTIIHASPSLRCRVPAQALGTRLRVGVVINPRLAELDFGAWEGQRWDAIDRTALDHWARAPEDFTPPGGEPIPALKARVRAFWHDVLAWRAPAFVVTHGGPLRYLVAMAQGRVADVAGAAPAMGTATAFAVSVPSGSGPRIRP